MKLTLTALAIFMGAAAIAQNPADTLLSKTLPPVIVIGNFPAYLAAIQQQRQADGLVSVLNLDLPGRFPDLNPAEALQRLPGVVLQRSHGEGRFVHIRGVDPALTTVQVNGEQIISPEARNRFLQFDLLPVDQLRAVEVWKTNRPDQDGDAIGGSINLLTRIPTAEKPNWQSTVAGGFNVMAGKPNGQAQLAYSGKNLMLNGSFWQDHRATENLETIYGIQEVNGQNQLFVNDLELRHFAIARRRLGLSGTYSIPFRQQKGRVYLHGMYVDFQEKNERQRLRYRASKGMMPGASDTILGARVGRDVQHIRETEQFAALQLGLERNAERWKWDAVAAYSYGLESEPEGRELDFKLSDVDLIRDASNSNFPRFQIANEKRADAYQNFELNELETEDERSTDQALTAKANGEYQFRQGKNYLKFGLKTRLRQKNSRANESIYDEYTGAEALQLPTLLDGGAQHGFMGNRYAFGQYFDWKKTRSTIDAHLSDFKLNAPETALESAAGNFDIAENTGAGYTLIHFEQGRWQWLAGARLEYTAYQYAADQAVIDSTGGVTRQIGGRKFSGDYAFLLPTVMAKYRANGLDWQASFGASYARPTFDQLAPFELYDQLNQVAIVGNPNLKPAFAWNFDLAAEKELTQGGSVSAGIFGKHIRHFIFTQQSRESRLWSGSQVDVLSTVPLNGEVAWLAGIELAWQQRLSRLPGLWSGLGIYANYTYTWSRAIIAEEEETGEEEAEGIRLPGQAAHSANLALWYDKKRWTGRIALNAQSNFLLQAAEPEDAESQLFYGGAVQLDATVGYALGRHLTLFAEGMNLLNTPLRYFTGDQEHPSKLEQYGAWGRLGLKMRW